MAEIILVSIISPECTVPLLAFRLVFQRCLLNLSLYELQIYQLILGSLADLPNCLNIVSPVMMGQSQGVAMWSTVFLLHFLHSFHKCILHISILSMSLCFIDRLGLCPVPASGLGVYVKYALLSRSVKCSWVIGLGPFHHDSSVSQTEATPFASLLNEKMGKAEPSQLIATHSPYIS